MTAKDLMKVAFILLLVIFCFYINCLGEFPEDDFQAVIISDVQVSNDIIFDQIEVYETTSFGDSDGLPFYLVGFSNAYSTIQVIRNYKSNSNINQPGS